MLLAGLGTRDAAAQTRRAASSDTTARRTATVPNVEIREIRPGVWVHTSSHTFPDGSRVPSNGLIVREGDHLLLVDTAWGELLTVQLLDEIARTIGLPVRRAIITHSHADRLAGVDILAQRGVRVLALPMTQRLAMQQGMPTPHDTLAMRETPGSTVRVGSVEVLYPGAGHAPDNLMVWIPAQHVLFGGCAVRDMSAHSLGNTADADLASWPRAIALAERRYPDAEVVVPGHGTVGGPELLHHTLELFKR